MTRYAVVLMAITLTVACAEDGKTTFDKEEMKILEEIARMVLPYGEKSRAKDLHDPEKRKRVLELMKDGAKVVQNCQQHQVAVRMTIKHLGEDRMKMKVTEVDDFTMEKTLAYIRAVKDIAKSLPAAKK